MGRGRGVHCTRRHVGNRQFRHRRDERSHPDQHTRHQHKRQHMPHILVGDAVSDWAKRVRGESECGGAPWKHPAPAQTGVPEPGKQADTAWRNEVSVGLAERLRSWVLSVTADTELSTTARGGLPSGRTTPILAVQPSLILSARSEDTRLKMARAEVQAVLRCSSSGGTTSHLTGGRRQGHARIQLWTPNPTGTPSHSQSMQGAPGSCMRKARHLNRFRRNWHSGTESKRRHLSSLCVFRNRRRSENENIAGKLTLGAPHFSTGLRHSRTFGRETCLQLLVLT